MKMIKLTQGQFALVDDDMYEDLDKHKWCADLNKSMNKYYAIRRGKKLDGNNCGKKLYMHRVVSGAIQGEVIDHINRNTLDNRGINLRKCTKSENAMNRGAQGNNSSGYKGVSFDKSRNKWSVDIWIAGKKNTLGRFPSKNDAARAYNLAARMYHGEFAYTNIIKD